jgi:hypothetical protein
MHALPRKLTELTPRTKKFFESAPPIRCKVLNILPPQLEKLVMSYSMIIVEDETGPDFSSLVWPVNLRHLSLRPVRPRIIHHLPPSVEDLGLYVLQQTEGIRENPNRCAPSIAHQGQY